MLIDDLIEEIFLDSPFDEIYINHQTYGRCRTGMKLKLKDIEVLKGSLSVSAQKLHRALELYMETEKEFLRLYAYATMLSDQDTREAESLAMKQEMAQLSSDLRSVAAFIEPEILSISQKKINQFFRQFPSLEIYRQFITDILRRRAHTLNEKEEKLVAEAGRMSDTAHDIFNILSNADLPYPNIKLSNGENITLNPTNYTLYRKSTVRNDRKKVFNNFFGTLHKFRRTFGTQLYGELKKNVFYKHIGPLKSSYGYSQAQTTT